MVDFEEALAPNNYYYSFASNGALVLGNEDHSLFFDYQTGEELGLETDVEWLKSRAESSIIDSDSGTWPFLFDHYYYLQAYGDGTHNTFRLISRQGKLKN